MDLADAMRGGPAAADAVHAVRKQLSAIPDKGIGYGMLRYLNPDTAAVMQNWPEPQIVFNYIGRVSASEVPEELRDLGWIPDFDAPDLGGPEKSAMPAQAVLDIQSVVSETEDGLQLSAFLAYPQAILGGEDVEEFGRLWVQALSALAARGEGPQD